MNIKKLLNILKETTKYINENKVCSLGYLLKAYKLSYEECVWILDRLTSNPKKVSKDRDGNIIYVEIE